MAGYRSFTVLTITALLSILISLIGVEGTPSDIQGDIQVLDQYEVVMNEDETLIYEVEGFFSVTRSGLEAVGTVSATMTVSEPDWGPVLSQTTWNSVQNNENYDFMVRLTIPNGTRIQEQNTYELVLIFYNALGAEIGSSSGGFTVIIHSIIPSTGDDDDNSSDDDIISPVEDESFPLWPIFIIIIVIGLIIIGIWSRKNLEFVREEDGSRRIMLREKDSGHILGRKKQPPSEIEL